MAIEIERKFLIKEKPFSIAKRSLKINEELSYKRGIAHSLHNIGNVYYDKGEFDTALEYLEKCLSVRKEIGLGQYSLLVKQHSLKKHVTTLSTKGIHGR